MPKKVGREVSISNRYGTLFCLRLVFIESRHGQRRRLDIWVTGTPSTQGSVTIQMQRIKSSGLCATAFVGRRDGG